MTAPDRRSIRLRGTGAWCSRWSCRYESAYGRLQKFAWANCLDASYLWNSVFHLQCGSHWDSKELLHGSWIKQERLRLPSSLTIFDGFLTYYGATWGKRLASARQFRFCRSCLDDGFHSIFYQIDGILRCPVHHESLTSQCAQCGHASGTLSLQPSGPLVPFTCPLCGKPFGHKLDPTRWDHSTSRRARICSALDPIARWLSELERRFLLPGDLEPPLAQLQYAEEYSGDSSEVTFAALAHYLVPLRLPKSYRHKLIRPLRFGRVMLKRMSDDRRSPRERVLSRRAVFKAIRRYLIRAYVRNHRRCLAHARHAVRVQGIGGMYIVMHDGASCPLAGALTDWILQHSWHSYQAMAQAEPPTYHWHSPASGNDVLWAHELLADFFSCAATALVRARMQRALTTMELNRTIFKYSILQVERLSIFAIETGNRTANTCEWVEVSGDSRLVSALNAYPCSTRSDACPSRTCLSGIGISGYATHGHLPM